MSTPSAVPHRHHDGARLPRPRRCRNALRLGARYGSSLQRLPTRDRRRHRRHVRRRRQFPAENATLNTPATEPNKATAAERVAGWTSSWSDSPISPSSCPRGSRWHEPSRRSSVSAPLPSSRRNGRGSRAECCPGEAELSGRDHGSTERPTAPPHHDRLSSRSSISATAAVEGIVSDPAASDKVATSMPLAFGVFYSLTAYWKSPRKSRSCRSGRHRLPTTATRSRTSAPPARRSGSETADCRAVTRTPDRSATTPATR